MAACWRWADNSSPGRRRRMTRRRPGRAVNLYRGNDKNGHCARGVTADRCNELRHCGDDIDLGVDDVVHRRREAHEADRGSAGSGSPAVNPCGRPCSARRGTASYAAAQSVRSCSTSGQVGPVVTHSVGYPMVGITVRLPASTLGAARAVAADRGIKVDRAAPRIRRTPTRRPDRRREDGARGRAAPSDRPRPRLTMLRGAPLA